MCEPGCAACNARSRQAIWCTRRDVRTNGSTAAVSTWTVSTTGGVTRPRRQAVSQSDAPGDCSRLNPRCLAHRSGRVGVSETPATPTDTPQPRRGLLKQSPPSRFEEPTPGEEHARADREPDETDPGVGGVVTPPGDGERDDGGDECHGQPDVAFGIRRVATPAPHGRSRCQA